MRPSLYLIAVMVLAVVLAAAPAHCKTESPLVALAPQFIIATGLVKGIEGGCKKCPSGYTQKCARPFGCQWYVLPEMLHIVTMANQHALVYMQGHNHFYGSSV